MSPTASLSLLERADQQFRVVLSGVSPQQANLPTPCSSFDVRALVNHAVYDLQSFTAMITGGQRGSPDADLIGDDWSASQASAADALLSAWRVRGTEGTLTSGMGELPAPWVLGMHTTNMVVHAWDLARATGQTAKLDDELATAALDWGSTNLKPQFRGQAFGPQVEVPDDAPVYEQMAGFFGRSPG